MPPDPYHRQDEKGEACRLAVKMGLVSLNPNADNWICNYTFYGIKNGQPVYDFTVDPDPNNSKSEQRHYDALDKQLKSTGRIY